MRVCRRWFRKPATHFYPFTVEESDRIEALKQADPDRGWAEIIYEVAPHAFDLLGRKAKP
jgi:hypothetical protein